MTPLLLVALVVDLATFGAVVPIVGIGSESNPLALRMYATFGLLAIVTLKIVAALVVLVIVRLAITTRSKGLALNVATAIWTIGAAANVAALAWRIG